MNQARILMGMPITVEITDPFATSGMFTQVYAYLHSIDERFSPYKPTSEVSQINSGRLKLSQASKDTQIIFALSEKTRLQTAGFFNIFGNGKSDPSGLVKGWAIQNAALLLSDLGCNNFYVNAGGDIYARGTNLARKPWRVGIRNPFNQNQIVKVVQISDLGIATSGTYVRGQHVSNPARPRQPLTDIVSLTVIGPSVYDADRFATAAFAMQSKGVEFISTLPGFEAYAIDTNGIATFTSGFNHFVLPS